MRKLWNRTPAGVWSMVTTDRKGNPNMNICSYVTAVSMKPKLLLVAVYHGTKTHSNLVIGNSVLVQLLTENQASLIRLLGKKSGHSVDKIALLKKRGEVAEAQGLPYLTQSAGYVFGVITSIFAPTGDHDLAVIEVRKQVPILDQPILTTEYLRQQGYIR